MKRLCSTLLVSKTVIQEDRISPFTCVLRYQTSSSKGKCQKLISSNSVMRAYLSAYWLANPNTHWLLTLGKFPIFALIKRLSLIFIWVEFFRKAPIPIFNPLLYTVCIVGGKWGAHSYSDSPKNNKETYFFWNRIIYLF